MLISVIVPIYNTEKYLRRCVDSILAQSYIDFELLLVNDGSVDGSAKICDEYAEADSRVRVFHKTNGGVSSARSLGLDNARGEWIAFVDSDDCIDEHFLSVMTENMSPDVDLIISSVSNNRYIDPNKFINDILSRRIPPQIWGKLYRRNVLKGALQLPRDLFWGEDLVTNVLVGLNLTGNVEMKNVSLYRYDLNESSISNNRSSSLEYEEYFLNVLQSKMGDKAVEYNDAFNYTKLYILEDLIVCKQKVNYELAWIKELIEWGRRNYKILTMRQRLVLLIKNNFICRYVLAAERKLFRSIG